MKKCSFQAEDKQLYYKLALGPVRCESLLSIRTKFPEIEPHGHEFYFSPA